MKITEFFATGFGNGSINRMRELLDRLYPWIQDICGREEISVLRIFPAERMPDMEYPSDPIREGYVYIVNDGAITKKVSWEEVRQKREAAQLCVAVCSPQTEIILDADTCVLLKKESTENSFRGWVSVDIFLCRGEDIKFRDVPRIQGWHEEMKRKTKAWI